MEGQPRKKTLEKVFNGASFFYLGVLSILILASMALIIAALIS